MDTDIWGRTSQCHRERYSATKKDKHRLSENLYCFILTMWSGFLCRVAASTESSVHVTPTRAREAWDSELAQAAQPDTAHVQHQHSHIWQGCQWLRHTDNSRLYQIFIIPTLKPSHVMKHSKFPVYSAVLGLIHSAIHPEIEITVDCDYRVIT